ncbi:hypothetical protein [Serratia liquefaciens]|nr:hypothetical protein [Serratia liquefaciens]
MKTLVQNRHLLVQRWFNMENKTIIKQPNIYIEPTELTEPTHLLRT